MFLLPPWSAVRKSQINDDVVSTREAAERLGVALRTVQLWVESGVLPAWKTAGGHRRIARSALDKLIAERRNAIAPAATASGASAAAPAAAASPDRLRLLLVEDEPDLLRLLAMVIEGWQLPLDVRTATNGFEALVRIGELRPDLLITDLSMPGMDGFRMLRSLRSFGEDYRDLDIIVVSALSPQEIEDRGGLPPGAQFFSKPVPFSQLEDLVRAKLQARGLLD